MKMGPGHLGLFFLDLWRSFFSFPRQPRAVRVCVRTEVSKYNLSDLALQRYIHKHTRCGNNNSVFFCLHCFVLVGASQADLGVGDMNPYVHRPGMRSLPVFTSTRPFLGRFS